MTDPNGRIRIATGQAKEKVWVDHVRLYEGQYEEEDLDELQGRIVRAVAPSGKLATAWASIKK